MALKICIIIESLSDGGAERSSGLLSIMLSKLGHEVYFITIFDKITYPFDGILINLGLNENTSGSTFNKLNRYFQIYKTLKHHEFDLVLDFRLKDSLLRELILNLLVFRKKKMVSMVRSFKLDWYFPKPKMFSRFIYKNYLGINTVSFEIEKEIQKKYNFSNIKTIYSPLDFDNIKLSANAEFQPEGDYIIAVGRLEPIKQFDKLLDAFSKTLLPTKGIKLLILGEGTQFLILKNLIISYSLENYVQLLPFQQNPFKYLKHAKFLVLSSMTEGFPRVIIESLACKTPVVAFNCKSGPSEIIKHEVNGLLVEDQNFNDLVNSLNKMIIDIELYNYCKLNSDKDLQRFSLNSIKKEWSDYLDVLEKS